MFLKGNVVEVKSLRDRLMKQEYIDMLRRMLQTKNNEIEIPYNAAGVLANA